MIATLVLALLAALAWGASVRGRLAEWRDYVDWSRGQVHALARDRDAAAAQGQRQRADDFDRAIAERRAFLDAADREYRRQLGSFPANVIGRLSGLTGPGAP